MVQYTNTAYAVIKNNTGVTLRNVWLSHQYSDDPEQSTMWPSVGPSGISSPALKVGYNTGFLRTGQDYWRVQYTLPDGSVWVSPGALWETLHKGDDGKTLTFTITGSIFTGFLHTTMQLHKDSDPQYNSWAPILLHNNFPCSVSAELSHQYSDDLTYKKKWGPLGPNATTPASDAFIVYFNTGFLYTGSDHWTIELRLDIPPYDNDPGNAYQPIKNSAPGKGCMLMASDNGKTQTFTVNGEHFTMGIASGGCSDVWRTWHGYSCLAFMRIRNDFPKTISSVLLSYRDAGGNTWRQTRSVLPSASKSALMMAEFTFLPFPTYWDVIVYLDDGTWYKNHTPNFECWLRPPDAQQESTFTVSSSRFTLGLPSGSCLDTMDYKGTFAPHGGRDLTKRYDQNAYIGSHNAFANFEAGFWYAQQTSSIATQLAMGATALLLDIWYKDGDIYLIHENAPVLQPFAANEKLSEALTSLLNYFQMANHEPITIIFQDEVDAAHQDLIKKAFVTSKTWDMVFNADVYDVTSKGWPTLNELSAMGKPLVVLTSRSTSPDFAFQWRYMSENVHGDQSLNQATWLNPRAESQGLDHLALCALNHFPTWSISSFILTKALERAAVDNAAPLLNSMVDACNDQWRRYPNYINADFWEIPAGGLTEATFFMNNRLRNLPNVPARIENGMVILTEIDDSRLLRGSWDRAAHWVDQHLTEICRRPDPDPSEPLAYQLTDAINLTLVVATLHQIASPGEDTVRDWVAATIREIVRYFLGIEPMVLQALRADHAAMDELCGIPYFLIERVSGISFEVTDVIRRRAPAISDASNHDQLLLAGMAGDPGVAAELTRRLAATREGSQTPTSSGLYDLTHEILYLHHIDPAGTADPALTTQLAGLVGEIMTSNADLGAELLTCYWLAGGSPGGADPAIRAAVTRLKTFSDEQPLPCQPDKGGGCDCPKYKEQVHARLTTILGLGTTFATAGEFLNS